MTSHATVQRSLGDPAVEYPLWPPLTLGCPRTSTDDIAYPLEVDYAYDEVPADLFTATTKGRHTGLDRWAPLLPPLAAPGLGEGRTPLVELEPGLYVKDESSNPTWSHKDRLNRCTVSAAVGAGAPGVVVASSGNHAASAAAYSARAGLPCVVFASAGMPPAVDTFLHAYGAVVLPVPVEARWPLMRQVVDRLGFHPVSNLTVTHTGHPFGPEGYKTVAYEIYLEIGLPGAVFIPTGYGELLYGVFKGFAELQRLGVTASVPRIFACQPAAGASLVDAMRRGVPAAKIDVGETDAYSIVSAVSGYRGVVAVRESNGEAVTVTDEQLHVASRELASAGLWVELSSAAGLAAHRAAPDTVDGPVVCISTSSGFKDRTVSGDVHDTVTPDWETVAGRLAAAGIRG